MSSLDPYAWPCYGVDMSLSFDELSLLEDTLMEWQMWADDRSFDTSSPQGKLVAKLLKDMKGYVKRKVKPVV